jgi:hypothetical protein
MQTIHFNGRSRTKPTGGASAVAGPMPGVMLSEGNPEGED